LFSIIGNFPISVKRFNMTSEGNLDKVSKTCNIHHMDRTIEERFAHTAKLLRVLGHPARLAMVEALRERPWCVCELAARLGLNNPTASKHLSLLNSVGIVEMEKDGTRVNCTLAMPCVFDMMYCANQNAADTNNNGTEADGAAAADGFDTVETGDNVDIHTDHPACCSRKSMEFPENGKPENGKPENGKPKKQPRIRNNTNE